jgi:creatinine amidohydrolase
MTETIKLEELTSPDIKAAIGRGMDTVIFAVGSNEQHGPCLPVGTDSMTGDALVYHTAKKLGKALKGPTINIGCSDHHMKFAGTISLRKETLQNVIKDYCASLVQHGFRRIVIIPTHGGNFPPIAEIKDELQQAHPNTRILAYTDLQAFIDLSNEMSVKLGVPKEEAGAHAGESEVSEMLWVREDLVKTDLIPEATGFVGEITEDAVAKVFKEGIGALSPIGVLGKPTKASAEHGKFYTEEMTKALVEFISKAE